MILPQRFWQKVNVEDSGTLCWVWTGAKISKGYGTFLFDGKVQKAHRLAWRERNGEIPEGLQVHHACHNTSCVNPAHMELVTNAENARRSRELRSATRLMAAQMEEPVDHRPEELKRKRRQRTHCFRGHPLTPPNVIVHKNGKRQCRECRTRTHSAYTWKQWREAHGLVEVEP